MSRPNITRVSNLQVKSDPRNKEKGFYVDALTTVQRDAIPTKTNGLIVYNTDTNTFQAYQNGSFISIYTSPEAQGGNLVMQSLATDPAGGDSVNGEMYYNTTFGVVRIRLSGVWENLNASAQAATGVGIVSGTALTLPSGTKAAVEVAGNQVSGFMYHDSTNSRIRVWANGAWSTVTIVAGP